MFKKLFNDPLFAFISIGILVFLFYYWSLDKEPVVELSPDNRAIFVEQYESLVGRKATPEDIAKIENDFIEEEVLFREALAKDFHLIDPAVRTQLIEQMRYQLTEDFQEPQEAQLVQYYLENIKRYYHEATVSFQHVYFANEPGEANTLLAALNSGQEVAGDEFWQGRDMPNYGESMIRGLFGKPFLDNLTSSEQDTWFGPTESLFGWHFYQVSKREPAMPMSFDQARQQVGNDYIRSHMSNSVQKYIKGLNGKYEIIRHEF
ncbi:peptidylprolyl isomerase [Paraglaciecola sp.]|jgi:hypothetical protein|uniref:peptidylprolyl isomerase n=1 Tax=Paraglaciecola sp. TaxID=1920173 RepID=UPI00273F407F|nr:peptidylprolyl isomerase [Paraglaciecola sp.]MDP5030688.1 peptidylprolyl isomerase [Paraglaciecola sp.]